MYIPFGYRFEYASQNRDLIWVPNACCLRYWKILAFWPNFFELRARKYNILLSFFHCKLMGTTASSTFSTTVLVVVIDANLVLRVITHSYLKNIDGISMLIILRKSRNRTESNTTRDWMK